MRSRGQRTRRSPNEVMGGYCEAAFQALREMWIPPLQTFQTIPFKEELRKLADRMVEKA